MKILHTSDWHLGHRLHEQSQAEEQQLFLTWLTDCIAQNSIDILLISGDVFDTGVPSTQSQKLYYDFLIGLRNTSCKHVVVTAGNHDAPGVINAPKELLHVLDIHVVGKASENIEEEVFQFSINGEEVIIGAVPYLRDQDIRRAVAGESFDEIIDRYKTALINHYNSVAEYCQNLSSSKVPIIAMGHLFAKEGSVSDSEQTIYVGGVGDIGASDFPDVLDYLALGHLHRPQIVQGQNRVCYSGSPYILSFSELKYDKNVMILDTDSTTIKSIDSVKIPRFREVLQIKGSLDECLLGLNDVVSNEYKLTPWVEVVLTGTQISSGFTEIVNASEELELEVLKVTLNEQREQTGIESKVKSMDIKSISPVDVFKMKCQEQDFDLQKNEDVMDAFNEVLQIVKGQ